MFLSVTVPRFASCGPIKIEYWMPFLSASERAFDVVRRMSSICVGIPACLSVEVILHACVSVSWFSGITATLRVFGSFRGAFCLSIASVMRSMPSATPTAGVGWPPKSWMS
jgi:hypothetical protein